MAGYNENFLKSPVSMPALSADLKRVVLSTPDLRHGIYADHITYTVVTDRQRRAPLFVAVNIDQKLLKKKVGSAGWKADPLFGKEFQLSNKYFENNVWDRGHLAMREQAGWGKTAEAARKSAIDTFVYSNATIQHENYNQDEWLSVENWVTKLAIDADDKITCFAGPIYGSFSRTIKPAGLDPAEIPASFFKVVVFTDKVTKRLGARAFIVVQDQKAMETKKGKSSVDRKMYDGQNYQTTITEIETRTGLKFPDNIVKANPLYYKRSQAKGENKTVLNFPERIDADRAEEVVNSYRAPRIHDVMDQVGMYIAAALVSPAKSKAAREWVSLINLHRTALDISLWTLEVLPYHTEKLAGKQRKLVLGRAVTGGVLRIAAGHSLRLDALSPLRLPDTGATLILKDEKGRLIDRVKYLRNQVKRGEPIVLFER